MPTALQTRIAVAAVVAWSLLSAASSASRAADPAARPAGDLPTADQLPSITELPDPFAFSDGSRVKTKADWDRRRAELRDLILGYEYGRGPAPEGPVKATEDPTYAAPKPSGSNAGTRPAAKPEAPAVALPEGAKELKLRLAMGPDGKVSVPLILTVPAGKGPFPVIVKGDLCWGRIKPDIVAEVAKRGYLLAEFDRTAVAADSKDRSVGVYPFYPDTYDWRDMTAWAWGYHHVIDYLLTRDDVDAKKVIVTGHSRGGKAALLAGALDERVALTCPNGSGAGGAGCWRHTPADAESLARITTAFPFWFSPNFAPFAAHIDRLPFDQHSVKALVAPRALLSTEGLGDRWANPEGTQITYTATKVVYDFLGAGDRIGVHFREGKHEHNAEDFAALLDFADRVLMGKKVDRAFDKLAFPDAPKLFSWSATDPGQKPATTKPAAAALPSP